MDKKYKVEDITCSVPIGLIIEMELWGTICDDYGYNPWAINEGMVDEDEYISIKLKDIVKYGLTNKLENNTREWY